ncbi:hypothetical protein [Nostoc flagelliforme]|uniref:hypothetical protein n=1 Tax=Nostoc flagelliforme TaxID=1306274 RepID=UPI0012FE08F6|nr:hypothetical protein [Nostoc flagelliforme]
MGKAYVGQPFELKLTAMSNAVPLRVVCIPMQLRTAILQHLYHREEDLYKCANLSQ